MSKLFLIGIGLVVFGFLNSAQAQSQPAAPGATPTFTPPKLGGYIQARETYQDDVGLTALINRARFSVDGSLPHGFSYRLLVEAEAAAGARTASTVSLRDAIIRWTRTKWTINAGQYKTPFSREYLMSITIVETPDRASVVDTLATKRDIGVSVDYALAPDATVSLGVYNGEGQNSSANRDSNLLVVTRATIKPAPFLTLAADGAAFQSDSSRYDLEAGIDVRGLALRGELIGQHRKHRDRDDQGWYALATYRLLPWLTAVARQEDFQRPSIGQARRMSASTGGVMIDMGAGRVRLLADYVSRKTGYPRVRKASVITQLQVRF